MNKEEFLEMRKEFGSLVANFDRFQKDCFIIDLNYNLAFFQELEPTRKLELEIYIIGQAIAQKDLGKSVDEIKQYIDHIKESYEKERESAKNKNNYAKQVIAYTSRISKEERQEVEDLYFNFMVENHPLVNLLANETAKGAYEIIKKYYFESNLPGLKEILPVQGKALEHSEINDENEYIKFSQVYFDSRNQVTKAYTEQSKKYPFVKREVFKDEMSIERERDELNLNRKKLEQTNKKAHEDFVKNFEFDFSL